MLPEIPQSTLDWLLAEDNPAVAVLTRRALLGERDDQADALWARRNGYPPVAAILEAMHEDGSWDVPSRDYQKYRGSLWQLVFLGELWADGDDERVQRALAYAFSRQLPDGSWSASNMRAAGSIPCLTANVARSVARLGQADDERVVAALGYCVKTQREVGAVDCHQAADFHLNGYCHMLTPKLLLLLAEVPRAAWPDGAEELRDACVQALRDKEVYRCLPEESREFQDVIWTAKTSERHEVHERFMAEHPELHYGDKPGWLRFGFPLSYNSDALEAMYALMAAGEARRPEYEAALDLIRAAADPQLRWKLRNSFNGKMYADIEAKGAPSKWLTLRALQVLRAFDR